MMVAATQYRTSENDMLDRICWRYYGRQSGAVEAVLEANRAIGLAAYGPVLPGGLLITLPELTESETATTTVSLWE
jgi:phage tail protein X